MKQQPPKISGFSMAKNATKLYYPVKQAIASVLPIVDEFVFALGKGDANDRTKEELLSLKSNKLKIIETEWNIDAYPNGMENAHQTDIAKQACSGDWLIHLQADEVIHEKYLDTIVQKCRERLHNKHIEGFLMKYLHFYGDYKHYAHQHGWYQREIRIIRNLPEIHSFWSAQSFRKIPNFDGKSYKTKAGTAKLRVEPIDACVYHYGWVRPPHIMQNKSRSLDTIHKGEKKVDAMYAKRANVYHYGNMYRMSEFKGTHPKVMQEWIAKFDWENQLIFQKKYTPKRPLMKFEKWKYRFLTFLEQKLFGGRHILAYNNWKVVKR